jgi:phosphoglycerate dehydrogenase-like enzyme
VLVNTARGAVVDAGALAEALRAGRLAAAALDVFDPEPLPVNHELFTCHNVVFSPHVAGRSAEAQARMNAVVEDVVAVLEGRRPRFAADPPEG